MKNTRNYNTTVSDNNIMLHFKKCQQCNHDSSRFLFTKMMENFAKMYYEINQINITSDTSFITCQNMIDYLSEQFISVPKKADSINKVN